VKVATNNKNMFCSSMLTLKILHSDLYTQNVLLTL
jgi:hypothetical protein